MNPEILSNVVLAPGVLDAAAEAALRGIPKETAEDVAGSLLADIANGRAKIANVERDGRRLGFVVFTVTPEHELTVNACRGYDGRENLVQNLIGSGQLLLNLARQCGCDSVAFSTARAGLVRAALCEGFRVSEVIMRKAVK